MWTLKPKSAELQDTLLELQTRQGDWKGAAAALEKALATPSRPGRELADQGRRKEASALLTKVRTHLAGH